MGNRYVTNIVDRYSGYVVSIPVKRINAVTTCYNLMTHWIMRFGIPDAMLSDQGSDFMANIIVTLCNVFGINKKITSAYNPATNGKVERYNRTMMNALKVISNERINLRQGSAPGIYIYLLLPLHIIIKFIDQQVNHQMKFYMDIKLNYLKKNN